MPKRSHKIINSLVKYKISLLFLFGSFFTWGCGKKLYSQGVDRAYSSIEPQIIPLDLPTKDEGIGGLIAVDINKDDQKDFIITKLGHIAVYDNSGKKLWVKKINIQVTGASEEEGLPGWFGPGVQAADVDGDRKTEILFLTKNNTLHIVRGDNGEIKHRIKLESPKGTEGWEHLVIANFRGEGDRDLLLQTTNAEGYRMGRYLAAYAVEDIVKGENLQPLWQRDDFLANAHNGARVADLDGDGKDEVLGGTIVGSQGEILFQLPLKLQQSPHLDSLFVADVRPDILGLEVLALEEGGENRIFLYNRDRLIWETHYKHQEAQNAAVGDFDPNRPGLEVWCRSRYNEHQKPFVFDARGKLIAKYEMDKLAPSDWTVKGFEVIFLIDWTGESKQLAAAKERHKAGDVAIFEPITGKFRYRFQQEADLLYIADVAGDWREELIVLNGNQLHIYGNLETNPNPNHSRLWTQNYYRRSKMTWNYYSP